MNVNSLQRTRMDRAPSTGFLDIFPPTGRTESLWRSRRSIEESTSRYRGCGIPTTMIWGSSLIDTAPPWEWPKSREQLCYSWTEWPSEMEICTDRHQFHGLRKCPSDHRNRNCFLPNTKTATTTCSFVARGERRKDNLYASEHRNYFIRTKPLQYVNIWTSTSDAWFVPNSSANNDFSNLYWWFLFSSWVSNSSTQNAIHPNPIKYYVCSVCTGEWWCVHHYY